MTALIPRGAPIAVVAPSSAYDPGKLERGLAILREAGHAPHLFPDSLRPHRYLAADDDHRLGQLVDALTDPRWAAVWMVRGGYGLTRLLDRVPWERLVQRPVLGFSDVTALFAGLSRHGGGPAVHAPVLHSLGQTDAASLEHLWRLLDGQPTEPMAGETWAPGAVEAPVVGGNLCMLATGCGTRHQVDASGAILVLEEVGEAAYRVDRSLQQLASAGVLDGVAGVAVGELVGCPVPQGAAWTLRDIFAEHLEPLGVPMVGELPIGHGARNRAFVWGQRGRLGDGRLTLT